MFKLWLEASFADSKKILEDLKKGFNVLIKSGSVRAAYQSLSSVVDKVDDITNKEYKPKGFWYTHLTDILLDRFDHPSSGFSSEYLSGFLDSSNSDLPMDIFKYFKWFVQNGEQWYFSNLYNRLGAIGYIDPRLLDPKIIEQFEDKIKTQPWPAYMYANEILHKRWSDIGKPEIEDLIGTDPQSATFYATKVLEKRWADIGKPEIEDVIGTDPASAYDYADWVLEKRWANIGKPEVEDVIGTSSSHAYYYAQNFLQKRWLEIGKPEVEDIILRDVTYSDRYKNRFGIKD